MTNPGEQATTRGNRSPLARPSEIAYDAPSENPPTASQDGCRRRAGARQRTVAPRQSRPGDARVNPPPPPAAARRAPRRLCGAAGGAAWAVKGVEGAAMKREIAD